MKKAVILSLFLLLTFLGTPRFCYLFAQENVIETETPIGQEAVATEEASVVSKVNYELPYPGMLPDNPFYFLKVIRDGIVKILINDDLKRARFSLENSDKRMYAGKLLIDKNKDELAVETISKSNNYLNDALKAIRPFIKAHPTSNESNHFLSEFNTATLKHMEIAEEVRVNIDKEFLTDFTNEQKRMKKIEDDAKSLLHTR